MATTPAKPKTTRTRSTAAKPKAAPVKKAAPTVEETVEATVKANQEAAEKVVHDGAEALKANFEKAFSSTREKFEESMKRFTDYSQDYTALSKENYEAFMASGTVLQKGMQALNAEIAAISKRNMEDSVAAMKSLTGAKTAKEFFELQSDLVRSSWDTMVADGNKIGEMMSEYTKDAIEPISTQVKKAVEQFSQPFAA